MLRFRNHRLRAKNMAFGIQCHFHHLKLLRPSTVNLSWLTLVPSLIEIIKSILHQAQFLAYKCSIYGHSYGSKTSTTQFFTAQGHTYWYHCYLNLMIYFPLLWTPRDQRFIFSLLSIFSKPTFLFTQNYYRTDEYLLDVCKETLYIEEMTQNRAIFFYKRKKNSRFKASLIFQIRVLKNCFNSLPLEISNMKANKKFQILDPITFSRFDNQMCLQSCFKMTN